MNTELPSGPALALLVVAALVQLILLVVGLVTWLRTPEDRIAGNRYAWLALVLVVGVAGPLVFLLAGRRPAPAPDPLATRSTRPGQESADRAAAAVDDLYGSHDR